MNKQPKTEVHVELGDFSSEIDISIIDRLHSLLNPQRPATVPSTSMYKTGTGSTVGLVSVIILFVLDP